MAEVLQYKCPACGGEIEFDSALQKMKCPYCDTEYETENLRRYDEALSQDTEDELEWETPERAWQEGEEESLTAYVCASCGGELVCEATTVATECPYCGNPTIVPGRVSGSLKPDYVIPFKLDKEAAKAGLKRHLQGKRLLPKVFQDENHIDEIKGIYVPFWLFGAEAEADVRYRATRVRSWMDRNYVYTETSFFAIERGGSIAFDHVPVDGSTQMADDLMESIEPYDFSEAVDFQTAFLSGYFADRYDVDAAASIDRANERVKTSTEQAFASTVQGYTGVRVEHSSVRLRHGKAKYALYPVWLLNTTWNGQRYTFAMNGQTGKFVGDLPMDKKAYWKWLIGLTAGIGAAAFALLYLWWLL